MSSLDKESLIQKYDDYVSDAISCGKVRPPITNQSRLLGGGGELALDQRFIKFGKHVCNGHIAVRHEQLLAGGELSRRLAACREWLQWALNRPSGRKCPKSGPKALQDPVESANQPKYLIQTGRSDRPKPCVTSQLVCCQGSIDYRVSIDPKRIRKSLFNTLQCPN